MSRMAGQGGRLFGKIDNWTMSGGTINNVHGDFNYYINRQDTGLIALSNAISDGAIHDSAERYPAGKCHPGTREEIIKTILEWINDPNPSCDALWLYGPAGAGKSAIMQTIAELLREWYKERYAGSFFFASGKPGRDQGSALFCTLAYQIATCVSGMREAVNNAMVFDVTLPKKSMDTQLKSLILEPFMRCQYHPMHTPTILIDGLDECQGSDTQRAILNLVANARTVAGVPLRFLVASRPEFWIRDTFDRQPLFDITKRLDLSDLRQASLDIKKYLEDGFAEIYNKNLVVMTGVKWPWPPTKELDRFVHDASGQFVYASTVLKFVGAEFCDPRTQLEIISTPGPLRASAFSDLDLLYTKILSVYPQRPTLLRVLGGLVVGAHPITIEKWLGVEHGELNMVLRAISSLLFRDSVIIDQDEDLELIYGRLTPRITFCHLSFKEYLMDGNRSGEFAIITQVVNAELFNNAFDLVIGSLADAQKHRDTPMVYDDMWAVLRSEVPAHASRTHVEERLKDLQLAIRSFTGSHIRTITLPNWKYILRHMSYGVHVLDIIRENRYGPSGSLLADTRLEIRAVEDECFRQLLSSTSFLNFENVPHFVQADDVNLDETYRQLGVSQELGKMFLTDNAHLIHVDFYSASHGNVQNNIQTLFPVYTPTLSLPGFLNSASRGGAFHSEYRKKYIRLSRQALTFLNIPQEQLLLQGDNIPPVQKPGQLSRFIINFLYQHDTSDVKLMEDPEDNHNMWAFIETLCTSNNWKSITMDSRRSNFEHERVVIAWLLRQLKKHPVPPLVNDFRERMVQTIGQIYELSVLPKFMIPYFSDNLQAEESWLPSITFPPPESGLQKHYLASENAIPPYNIRPQVTEQYSWPSYIGASSTITTILEEGTYCPAINRANCYALFLEYHLLTYAAYFHSCIIENSSDFFGRFYDDRYSPKYFAQWFLHAYPSTKVLVGLWTLRYVCRRMKPNWYPPTGFCSGAMDFLETYGLDPTGELHLWLEGLQDVSMEDSEEDAEDSEEDAQDRRIGYVDAALLEE